MPSTAACPTPSSSGAVRAREATAERISYLTEGTGPGIPDPSPIDRAVVEFDANGITCTAKVSGLADHDPVVGAPTCDNVGLTTTTRDPDGYATWFLSALALGLISAALFVMSRPSPPVAEAGEVY